MTIFKMAADEELTLKKLDEFLVEHQTLKSNRYNDLYNAYVTDYEIFDLPKKDDWKPDNRIAVNFAKYITDTMNGFFLGVPIKVTSDDEKISEYVELLSRYSDLDDNDAELAKLCDIFGKGYEMYYVDEQSNICITYVSPMDGFMIFDDSILERPLYFVRTYVDKNNVLHGSISDSLVVKWFIRDGELSWYGDEQIHGFDGVPATEYRENEESIGIFEPVMSMINAYNKAISEKANDVDYFADAYLKILGAKLDEDGLQGVRRNRIINFKGMDAGSLVVEFLQKPDGDNTQEHLIDRLERLIFQMSMVANISDESFGASSGIALKYKLQAMSNLARTKERKFTSGMNRRYMLIFSNPLSGMNKDDWVKLNYHFTLNYPANVLEETEIAKNLVGVTSKETQLKVLSIVDNVKDEIHKQEEEQDTAGYLTDYPTSRTDG